jgi:hypothetical protein
MTIGTKANFQNALDKAAARGGMLLIQRDRGDGRYDVQGSCDRCYVVTVTAGDYACTCKASAEFQRCCYHMASVAMFRASQSAVGIAPAAPRSESDAAIRARLLVKSRARTRHITELEGSSAECFGSTVAA